MPLAMVGSSCPTDRALTIAQYLEQRFSADESLAFEKHFLQCPRCSEAFQFTDTYIAACRRVASSVDAHGLTTPPTR